MSYVYADLLPAAARGRRQPGPGEPGAAAELDPRRLSPDPAQVWSMAGRQACAAERADAEPLFRMFDPWRRFDGRPDQGFRPAMPAGHLIGSGKKRLSATTLARIRQGLGHGRSLTGGDDEAAQLPPGTAANHRPAIGRARSMPSPAG